MKNAIASFGEASGLSAADVKESQRRHGSNVLTPPLRDPEWKKLLKKFDDATIKILLVAAFVSLLVAAISKFMLHGHGGFVDGLGILLAVLLATLVAYINEKKSNREFEILNRIKEETDVKVTRDGVVQEIPISDVVVGDLVHLALGDRVPSDGVLVYNQGVTLDESLLTGEAEPVEKLLEDNADAATRETAFTKNRVYRGTYVTDGHGAYETTEVGDLTEVGKIAQDLGDEEEKTPLQQKLDVLAGQISVAGTVAATLIFDLMAVRGLMGAELFRSPHASFGLLLIFGLASLSVALLLALRFFRSSSRFMQLFAFVSLSLGAFAIACVTWGFTQNTGLAIELLNLILLAFVVAVTIVVVAVPEGLPMMVNVSLALNMRKMAKENCLVRKLVASETIGSATVICTDKTGTLTQNRMQPVWFFTGLEAYSDSAIPEIKKHPEWESLIRNIAINSISHLVSKGGETMVAGNATEGALLMLLQNQGIDYQGLRGQSRVVHQVDYNSARKMSLAVVQEEQGLRCFVKGAPEIVLARCSQISVDGRVMPMNGAWERILKALEQAASEHSLRIIGFSERLMTPGEHSGGLGSTDWATMDQHTFIGLVGIADPLRPEVTESVEMCKRAGIVVKMISGDDPRTAAAIARQCGILDDGGLTLTSAELTDIGDDELDQLVDRLQVLARSSPKDKRRLVDALRRRGAVVAMTGDGVNDGPALRAADVGLSMGRSGTEVAKEASDIVLVDDNFSSIVTSVRWGRALFSNIQRFLQFQLSVNVVALLCAFAGPLMGVPLPLTVPQLLWINIIMDTFAALALSTEPPRAWIMSQPPVPRTAHIITRTMGITIGINSLFQVAVLLLLLGTNFLGGESELERLTIFFTTFVMFQFWHKFNCRSLNHDESPFHRITANHNFIIIVATITIVQVVMVQLGGAVGQLFRTTPLPLETWGWILLLTSSILPVAWLARWAAFRMVGRNVSQAGA